MRIRTELWAGENMPFLGSALSAIAGILWLLAVSWTNTHDFTDLGLVAALPWLAWVALALLAIGFSLTLFARATPNVVLLFHTALLIVLIFGAPAIIEDGPRMNAAWRHMGIVEHIGTTGEVDPEIDAYFNWPGFFIMSAFLADAAGVEAIDGVVAWTPVLLNLAYLGPLLLLMRTVTHDLRLMWMAVWVFYITNWVGQDYFSPQGFGYLLWLTLISILLIWFRPRPAEEEPDFPHPALTTLWRRIPERVRTWSRGVSAYSVSVTREQRIGLFVICVVIFLVINGSHQLTPFATLGGVFALVVFNQLVPRWLPILMGSLILIWLLLFATSFWSGHGASILRDLGSFGSSLSQSTAERVRGSDGHLIVVRFRLIFTAIVWAGAAVGILLRIRSGHRDVAFWALMVTPFFLIAGQSYGGEMLLRVYFFALPFAAFFLASLLMTIVSNRQARSTVPTVAVLCFLLLAGMVFARYGNERMEHFTPAEAAAADVMYEEVEPGSTIVTANWNAPIRHQGYATYHYVALNDAHPLDGWIDPETGLPDVEAITLTIADQGDGDDVYLFLTRSQAAANELLGISPITQDDLLAALEGSGHFSMVYSNGDAVLLQLLPNGE